MFYRIETNNEFDLHVQVSKFQNRALAMGNARNSACLALERAGDKYGHADTYLTYDGKDVFRVWRSISHEESYLVTKLTITVVD